MKIRIILLTLTGCLLCGAAPAQSAGNEKKKASRAAAQQVQDEKSASRAAAQQVQDEKSAPRAAAQQVQDEKSASRAAAQEVRDDKKASRTGAAREPGRERRASRAAEHAADGKRDARVRVKETAAPQEPSQYKGAHLRMDVATHDFGDVPRKGGDLKREFTYTNDGSVPLVLTRVITSCSCLKASFSKRPVPPGGTGVIRIIYQPLKSDPGVFNKVIQIYSNSVDGRDVITVQGNSIDARPRKLKTDKMKIKYK